MKSTEQNLHYQPGPGWTAGFAFISKSECRKQAIAYQTEHEKILTLTRAHFLKVDLNERKKGPTLHAMAAFLEAWGLRHASL